MRLSPYESLHGPPRPDRRQPRQSIQRQFGSALTPVGEAMAQSFARAYASLPWEAIYTSPVLRTRQTAAPLCALTGMEATVEEGLKEISYAEWEGLEQADVKARWPEALEYWAADVASRGTPGGETAFHVAARAMAVVERIRPATRAATSCSSNTRRSSG